jgi:beta-phosphoglucomutase-like phosphatase (HAD superfamily)
MLFDHDGVLVDTEFWYYKAGERALADIGLTLDKDQYLRDMNQGLGTWTQARAAGIDEQAIGRQREVRDDYYQEYLRTEGIEIEGVVDALAELSRYVRMAIVTTAKRADWFISRILPNLPTAKASGQGGGGTAARTWQPG